MEEKVSPAAVASGLISCTPRYLVSPPGILKLIELVSTNILIYLYGFMVVFRHQRVVFRFQCLRIKTAILNRNWIGPVNLIIFRTLVNFRASHALVILHVDAEMQNMF